MCSIYGQFYVFRREIASQIYDYRRMPSRKIPSRNVFGKRLREIRARRNIAQYRLGVLAGLEESSSSARMSRYESGEFEPPFQFAEALARVLAISPAYFFCPDDELAELILTFSTLTEPKRRILHQTALTLSDGE